MNMVRNIGYPSIGVLHVLDAFAFKVKSIVAQEKDFIRFSHLQEEIFQWLVIVMVDKGVNQNFMKEEVVIQPRLKLQIAHSSFKVINLEVENVVDVVIGVILNLGIWNGPISFMVVLMVHILR